MTTHLIALTGRVPEWWTALYLVLQGFVMLSATGTFID